MQIKISKKVIEMLQILEISKIIYFIDIRIRFYWRTGSIIEKVDPLPTLELTLI